MLVVLILIDFIQELRVSNGFGGLGTSKLGGLDVLLFLI